MTNFSFDQLNSITGSPSANLLPASVSQTILGAPLQILDQRPQSSYSAATAKLDAALATALAIAQTRLTDYAARSDFLDDLRLAFGANFSRAAAIAQQEQWVNANFANLPSIEVRTRAEMQGAFGAYAASTDTIYLNADFLASASIEQVASVLIEEIGHQFDTKINLQDAPGDEGQIFSALALGQRLSDRQLADLQHQIDTTILNLDGTLIAVETNSLLGETVDLDVRFVTFGDTFVDTSMYSTSFTVGSGQEVTNQAVTASFSSSGFPQTLTGNVSVDVAANTILVRFAGTAQGGEIKFIFSSLVGGVVTGIDSVTQTASSGTINGVIDTLPPSVSNDVVTTGIRPFGFQPGVNVSQTSTLTFSADTTPPTLTSITRSNPLAETTSADTLIFQVSFNENVQNVNAADFVVNGSTTATITNVSGSGSVYNITVSGGNLANLNGIVGLNLAGGQNITDLAGNALPAGEPAIDQTYIISNDNTAPTFTSITRSNPTNPTTSADTLVFQVSFDEAVQNVDANDFTVTGATGTTRSVSGSGSTYTLTVSGGDLANFNGTVGLNLAGGQNITDLAGNALPAGEPTTDETYRLANLVISEIMFNPSSPEDNWEWVELYNTGSSAIDLSGYVLDDINGVAHSTANIASGTIAAGQTAILYNADDVSATDFEAAWGTGINLVAVTNWAASGLNNGGDTVGLWSDFASYSGDHATHAEALVSVMYPDSLDDGAGSIYLTDLTNPNSFALSTAGATTPAGRVYTSANAGSNIGNDIGSPGGLLITFSSPTITPAFVLQNTTDHILYQLDLAVTPAAAELTGASFTTGGSYITADLAPNSFELFYSADATFDVGDTSLGTQAVVASGGMLDFTGLSQIISGGTTGTLFLVADIAVDATPGNTINIAAPTLSDITIALGRKTGTLTAGGAQAFDASPTITAVTSPTPDDTYGIDAVINVTVTFSEAVTLAGGNLILTLDTGGTVTITPFANATTATGTYTVVAGQDSPDLNTTGVILAGGATLQDATGNAVGLTIPGGQSLADNQALLIDATHPTVATVVPSVSTIQDANVGTGSFSLTVSFSEDMDINVTPTLTFPTEDPSSTLTFTSGIWTTSTTYVASYDVVDMNTVLANIDVQVTGAQDLAGNLVSSSATVDLFSIATASSVAFTAASYTVSEAGGNSTVITLVRTGDRTGTTTVQVDIIGGTATGGDDYDDSSFPLTVTFAPGEATQTVTIPIADDSLYEPGGDETILLSLSNSTNGQITQATTTLSLTDNDNQPTVTLNLTGSPAAENGGVATVTATLSNPSTEVVTVDLGLTGTATGGTDYTAAATSITINPGDTTGSVTLLSSDDSLVEGDETILVDITTVTNGSESSTQQVTATITDDDTALVSITASQPDAAEPGTNGEFTIALSTPSSSPTTVNYTVTGDAVSDIDYTALTGSVVIAANQTSVTLPVSLLDDGSPENPETVVVTLTGTDNSRITVNSAVNTATVTIADDDNQAPTVTAALTQVFSEDAGETVINLLDNARDADGDTLTVTDFTLTSGEDFAALGALVNNNDGTVTLTPSVYGGLMEGATRTATYRYTIADGNGGTVSQTATITIAGRDDIYWHQRGGVGTTAIWQLNEAGERTGGFFIEELENGNQRPVVPLEWKLAGVGDFNGDGYSDMVWRFAGVTGDGRNGPVGIWALNNEVRLAGDFFNIEEPDTAWELQAVADIDGDGDDDLIWRNNGATVAANAGLNALWLMENGQREQGIFLPTERDLNWSIGGVGDFDGDGTKNDILWRNITTNPSDPNYGANAVWFLDDATSTTRVGGVFLDRVPDANWRIEGVADINGDTYSDIFWRNGATGENVIWFMEQTTKVGDATLPTVADLSWDAVV